MTKENKLKDSAELLANAVLEFDEDVALYLRAEKGREKYMAMQNLAREFAPVEEEEDHEPVKRRSKNLR
jgi:hypothetical protein